MTKYYCYEEYLKSDEWKIIKRLAKESANGKCRFCNSTDNLQVHHRKYFRKWGQERLCDLTVLCERCHGLAHACIDGIYELDTTSGDIDEFLDLVKLEAPDTHEAIIKQFVAAQYNATIILFDRTNLENETSSHFIDTVINSEQMLKKIADEIGCCIAFAY